MVILKKIIILTEYQNSGASGIVKLENFAGRTSCFVRVLGVADEGEVCIKCGEDIMYCGSLVTGAIKFGALYDLTKPIYIAVAKEGKIVCMGSNTGRFLPSVLSGELYRYYAERNNQNVSYEHENQYAGQREVDIDKPQNNDENIQHIEENREPLKKEQSPVEKTAVQDSSINEEPSEQETISESANNTSKKSVKDDKVSAETKVKEPFYKQIENSMQELFDKYESDSELNLLVPDSKWARVPVDDQNYYVVGLIYSDGKPNLICYGVPDKDSSNPPANTNDCRQWLELEKGGRGYWMMYQSAVSGQTLTTQII